MRSVHNPSMGSLIVAWLAGSLVTYFLLGFLKNFYPAAWQLVLWALFAQTLAVLIAYYLYLGLRQRFVLARHWQVLIVLFSVLLFSLSVIWLVTRFPRWFDAGFFLLAASLVPWFFGLAVASLIWIWIMLRAAHRRGWEASLLSAASFQHLLGNLPGILLMLLFLVAYFALAFTYSPLLQDPTQNFDDNFYDADPTSWMNRFAGPAASLIEMRPVHPFAFLIFRPLTWLLALLLNGSRFYAALLLNSMAGALCVFLAWLWVRRWSSSPYAALVAALLGLTASHLVFSTFLETYIFSAAALIGFLILVDRPNRPVKSLILPGLLIFGITISNFVQACILFLASELKLGKFVKYFLSVLVLALVLAWVQHEIYPTSQPFYDPAQMIKEDRYSSGIGRPDRTSLRAYVLARTITLYSTVGPRPLALLQEVGCIFPCFKTYKPRYGTDLITSYAGFGSWLARVWFLILALSGAVFAWRLIRSPRQMSLQIGLVVCILFNFLLHLVYGDDPMLYSPDWTFALIFFTALSFKDLAARVWFQLAALAFLIALMINNWLFLRSMLVAVEPFL